jgi:hypothetical protein
MLLGAAVLVGGGILAGNLHRQKPSSALTSTTDTTVPTMTFKGYVLAKGAGAGCAAAANGIKPGARVSVLDFQGTVLGTSQLGPGLPANGGGCTWAYTMPIPVVSSYQVQVGQLPVASVTRSSLTKQAWNFYENDTTDSSQLENIESGV